MRGRVVEIGAGTGANFRHHPLEVTQVVAVEPKPRLRAHVEKAATDAPVQVEVAAGRAEKLPSEDDGFDVAVFSPVLCTFADVPGALAEARRVLKPGGKLLFYEHVGSERPGFRRVQKALAFRWRLIGGGCHLTRDTERAIQEAGFTVEDIRRFLLRDQRPSQPRTPVDHRYRPRDHLGCLGCPENIPIGEEGP